MIKMKCTDCGQICYNNKSPEVVFKDKDNCICEECSIDYEEVDGKVQYREDLTEEGSVRTYKDIKLVFENNKWCNL
jgi:hypothetical protein